MYSSSGWDSYAWDFQAISRVAEVLIHNPGVEEDPACGPLIDFVAMRALYPPRLTNKNVLKNGDFEEGSYVFPNTTYGYGVLILSNIEDDHSLLPSWMVESLKAVKHINSDHFSVPQRRRAIELVAGKESVIAQDGGESRVEEVEREVAELFYEIFFLSFANRVENLLV